MFGFKAVLPLAALLFGVVHGHDQVVIGPAAADGAPANHITEQSVLAALAAHPDPVDALIALQPEAAEELTQERLLHVNGEAAPRWLTEGDKLRLRREGKKFVDITDYHEFYEQQEVTTSVAGKANLPNLTHGALIRPLFAYVSTERMFDVLKHMTSYYNRYFGSTHGARSSRWLHDHIAEIIAAAPFGTQISLEYFTHTFPQSSIIARFEPKVRNFSHPVTILGAHQDSANYLFPLLPAPGADDDCSGTVSILETFRILAENGYIPLEGPVEFHWYAAEEGGLLGSQAIARYKKEQGARIGAMLEFDMTAYIAKNATESIGIVRTESDAPLTDWVAGLATEYSSIPAKVYDLGPKAGSDYMSFTRLDYPATFATEGDPLHIEFPGDMDPYVHSVNDTMDVNDEKGYFSLEHMARFTELAIAFAVEQAGWDNKWR